MGLNLRFRFHGSGLTSNMNAKQSMSSSAWKDLPTSEPADPDLDTVDHTQRRSTRLVNEDFDVDDLPDYLVECGCSECDSSVDPLSAQNGAFSDVLFAQDVCPSPRAMTIKRASESYIVRQKDAVNRSDITSRLRTTKDRYRRLLRADIQLRDEMTDPTLVLLSLRLSPIDQSNGQQRWVEPVTLDNRLSSGWTNCKWTLDNRLASYEYVWITTPTRHVGTPHRHVVIYTQSEVSIGDIRSAVHSYVNNTHGAEFGDHPVEVGQSDAGIIDRDPTLAVQSTTDHPTDDGPFTLADPSAMIVYVAQQLPHWVIKNVYNSDSDIHNNSALVDGAAVSVASNNDWFGCSSNFPV